jgi:hypothetical protein
MFAAIGDAFLAYYPEKYSARLDFEYKKALQGWLEIKQVREAPRFAAQQQSYFLLNNPVTLSSIQQVHGDLFNSHRLKSRWTIQATNAELNETNMTTATVPWVTWTRASNGALVTFSGSLTSLPNATLDVFIDWHLSTYAYHWTETTPAGPINYALTSYSEQTQTLPFGPGLMTPKDIFSSADLRAEYPQPLPYLDSYQGLSFVTNADIHVEQWRSPRSNDFYFDLRFTIPNTPSNINIRTGFWLQGDYSGYPFLYYLYAHIIGNLETTIEGLTSEPIHLQDFFSQTFCSDHFEHSERFIFEPRLEPGISQTFLAELRAKDIAWLILYNLNNVPSLKVMGFNGEIRDFP